MLKLFEMEKYCTKNKTFCYLIIYVCKKCLLIGNYVNIENVHAHIFSFNVKIVIHFVVGKGTFFIKV